MLTAPQLTQGQLLAAVGALGVDSHAMGQLAPQAANPADYLGTKMPPAYLGPELAKLEAYTNDVVAAVTASLMQQPKPVVLVFQKREEMTARPDLAALGPKWWCNAVARAVQALPGGVIVEMVTPKDLAKKRAGYPEPNVTFASLPAPPEFTKRERTDSRAPNGPWGKKRSEREREVDEHVARGEVTEHDSTESFIAHLDKLSSE